MRWATIWKACVKKNLKYVDQMKDKIEDFIDKNLKEQSWIVWRGFVWLRT